MKILRYGKINVQELFIQQIQLILSVNKRNYFLKGSVEFIS